MSSLSATLPPSLHLDIELDAGDLWGAIEWTLATARRTGLMLKQLDLAAASRLGESHLRLEVTASEATLLPLFVKRLENGVDVRAVHCAGRPVPAQDEQVDAYAALEPAI